MDIEMPGLSAFEAVRQIRRLSHDKVIYLSAFVQDGYIQTLSKPKHRDTLQSPKNRMKSFRQ